MTIAIFPVITSTTIPAAVSRIGGNLLVANTDVILRVAAILPLPIRQLS